MNEKSKKLSEIIIRISAILLNLGIFFYCIFILILFLSAFTNDDILMTGVTFYLLISILPFLIITTYFLWYLKRSNENLFGIFVVIPASIIFQYIVFKFEYFSVDIILFIAFELIASIIIVFMAIRRGHIRK